MSAPPYSGPDEQENQGRVQIPGSGAISSRLIWEPGEIAVIPHRRSEAAGVSGCQWMRPLSSQAKACVNCLSGSARTVRGLVWGRSTT